MKPMTNQLLKITKITVFSNFRFSLKKKVGVVGLNTPEITQNSQNTDLEALLGSPGALTVFIFFLPFPTTKHAHWAATYQTSCRMIFSNFRHCFP